MNSTLNIEKSNSYKLFNEIAGTYDFLNTMLSMGLDRYWRKKLLSVLPQKNELQVLDLATGTADVPLVLARDSRVAHITGMDLSEEMIAVGNKKILQQGMVERIRLQTGDACQIPSADQQFDLVTLSFGIRNFPDYKKSLTEIYRVLRPGGRVLILEFGLPTHVLIAPLYRFYFRHILPHLGRLVSRHSFAYTYLNQTVESFPWGEDLARVMRGAGLAPVRPVALTFGTVYLYQGERPLC